MFCDLSKQVSLNKKHTVIPKLNLLAIIIIFTCIPSLQSPHIDIPVQSEQHYGTEYDHTKQS